MSQLLQDGYPTLISFSANPNITMKVKEVTPPSIEAGGKMDRTSMHNTRYRTASPKRLVTLGDGSVKVFWGTDLYSTTQVDAMIGVNQLITVTFPDSSTYAFWGWIDSFKPDPMREGVPPEATMVVVPSNLNSSDEETAPVETPGT